MTVRKTSKDQDMFGKSVHLNFNHNGETHNTLCGGISSILLKLLICAYTIFNLWLMFTYGVNVETSSLGPAKYDDIGPKTLEETGFIPVFRMLNAKTKRPMTYVKKDMDKYFNIVI